MSVDDLKVDTYEVEAWISGVRSKIFSGTSIVEKIDKLLEMKVENEIIVQGYLRYGIESGKVTVEKGMELLARSKDTIGELVKSRQLLAGKATEIVGKDDGVLVEVEGRLSRLMGDASEAVVSSAGSLETARREETHSLETQAPQEGATDNLPMDVVDNGFPTSVVDKIKVSGY